MNKKKKGLILLWTLNVMPSLISIRLLYFPVLTYHLWNYLSIFGSVTSKFSKVAVRWRSVSSGSVDYLNSYLLISCCVLGLGFFCLFV